MLFHSYKGFSGQAAHTLYTAVMLAGQQQVIEGVSRSAHVGVARRARRDAHPHRSSCLIHLFPPHSHPRSLGSAAHQGGLTNLPPQIHTWGAEGRPWLFHT